MESIKFELGQRVQVRARLKRMRPNSWRREWREVRMRRPREGIIVGHRVKQNGRLESDAEYPWVGPLSRYFVPDEYIPAYLVAVDIRKGFLVVPVDAIEPI